MKIQYASDIHLELSDNSRFINTMPFEITGDVLVFAGDIGYLRDKTLPNMKFWKWASANYREVLLVPGNHEFYGNGDVLAYGDSWSRKILPNVHYYQNKVVRIDDTDFIKRSVAESTAERIVVVTHHLPTMAVVAPEHKGNLLNSAFATELGDFIADSRIDVWIFGHSHANIDATIGNTRLVCNQLGYVAYGEHLGGFDRGKFIEI